MPWSRCTGGHNFFSGILDFGLARSSERAFASGFPTTKAPSSPLSFIVVGDVSLTASICMHVVHALSVFRNAIVRHAMSSAAEVVRKHVVFTPLNIQALNSYQNTCKKYEIPLDEDTVQNAINVIKSSRVTLVEVVLYSAIKKSFVDADAAKADINNQVKAFGKADIVPHRDLHKCLWSNAGKIVRGKQVM